MNKNLLIVVVLAMVLSACGPAGNQELVSQSISPTSTEDSGDMQLEYTN